MNSYFKYILASEDERDPGFVRLVKIIFALSALAGFIIAAVLALTLTRNDLWVLVTTLVVMSILCGIALFLANRNVLWPGRVLLPAVILLGLTFLAIKGNGLHDSSIAGFTFVIILTSLITGQRAIPLATFLTLLGVWTVAYADMTGITRSTMAQKTGMDDVAIISMMQVIAAASLNGLMTRLSAALKSSHVNEQAQIKTNRELRELQSDLEKRVAERTKALSSVAEVSTAASTILETDQLLQQVVDLAKERFGFYHAHIYLLNETGDTLVLASGAGEVGRQMVAEGRSIPLDREQSLVARAAREKKGVTVNDVTQTPDFLPHPLLPDTHSEMAVPMMVGEQVIGVFDVQSEIAGHFTEADIAVQTTLAAQVAAAVQNSRLYTQAENAKQEALRTTAQLSEALQIAKLANWEYDVARDRFLFNDHFYSIFHTTAQQEGGYELSSAEYSQRLVHPDDLPMVGAEIGKALNSKDRHYHAQLEHRILYRDGGYGYISVNVHIDRDEQGNILRYYGANQDITERRRLEELNRKRALEQEAINQIAQKIQSTITIEEALQVAAREVGHVLGGRETIVFLEPPVLAMDSGKK